MDQPGEWYFEQDKLLLYLIPNATKGQTIDNIDISLPVLNTLISIASNRSTSQEERVHGVSFVGFEFSQTRSTFMSEPYEVPSAGDWSVHVRTLRHLLPMHTTVPHALSELGSSERRRSVYRGRPQHHHRTVRLQSDRWKRAGHKRLGHRLNHCAKRVREDRRFGNCAPWRC